MRRQHSSAVIGVFVIVAAALLVVAVVVFGSGRLFHKTYPFVVYFRGSVSGLASGAPVKFKGVEIGTVRRAYITLSTLPADSPDVRIPVVIQLDPRKIGNPGATGNFTDQARITQFIDAGLRAQLGTTSFVTNLRYVNLDVFPGSPKDLVSDPAVPYPEIPSLPTSLENAEKNATELLARLSKLDLEATFGSAQRTLQGLERLANAPELEQTLRSIQRGAASFEETSRNLNAAVVSFRKLGEAVGPDVTAIGANVRRASESAARVADASTALLGTVRDVVEPAGPAVFRFEQSLTEIAATARSLRHLIEKIDRDPAVLLRGGNP